MIKIIIKLLNSSAARLIYALVILTVIFTYSSELIEVIKVLYRAARTFDSYVKGELPDDETPVFKREIKPRKYTRYLTDEEYKAALREKAIQWEIDQVEWESHYHDEDECDASLHHIPRTVAAKKQRIRAIQQHLHNLVVIEAKEKFEAEELLKKERRRKK